MTFAAFNKAAFSLAFLRLSCYPFCMELESAVFAKRTCDFDRLRNFGFRETADGFLLRAPLSLKGYEAEVSVSRNGAVFGRVLDSAFDDEYLLLRAESARGFADEVSGAYRSLLERIADACFDSVPFASPQANRIARMLLERFGDKPDFPWKDDADSGVFRVSPGGKWYALFMRIDAAKLGLPATGKTAVVNVKGRYAPGAPGIFPAYHMNKTHWLTVALDGALDDDAVLEYVCASRDAAASSRAARRSGSGKPGGAWIVPANVGWFDVKDYVESNADGVPWESRARMSPGETVYLYLTAPLSCVKYKLRVIRVEAGGESGQTVKRLKLEQIFEDGVYDFSFLKARGVRSVRSARRLPEGLDLFG